MNLYPYTTGHLMVIPYKHTAELSELDFETTSEMMELLKRWTDKVKRILRAEGCNIGMNLGRAAGAGIADHLHMHLVPRWIGDENFMPIIGETKVLPDALRSIYLKLSE
jgi:ATP adenylyltransferase